MSEPISERSAFRSGWLGLVQKAQAEIAKLPAAWKARLIGGKEKFGYSQSTGKAKSVGIGLTR
ncbi:hypothetical protein G6L29_10675 [Agrobacterium rhizogenes]|uniref:hypothetical protein n=1 Tax=Rhizobium rhizogenes TaxID=359 RepID=UPI001571DE02|nr:hypothetical protein [Rhizobium rhizogenes]NTI16099.1 hypothetical protein [Rhizobium rhizogenes]